MEFVEAHFAANPTYRFLTGSTPTLADFFLAPEFDQLLPEAFNIFNFTPYPRVTAWLKAVQTDVANYRKNFQPVVDMVSTVLGSK